MFSTFLLPETVHHWLFVWRKNAGQNIMWLTSETRPPPAYGGSILLTQNVRRRKRKHDHSQSKNTFIYITWITSANKNLLYRATVLIRLVLTSEVTSRVSGGLFCSEFSNHFQFEIPECPLTKTARERRHQRRVDQRCDSSNNSGVKNARSVFFSGQASRLHFLLPLGGHSSSMFPLEVSGLEKLMKKCLDCADHTTLTLRSVSLLLESFRGFFKTSGPP